MYAPATAYFLALLSSTGDSAGGVLHVINYGADSGDRRQLRGQHRQERAHSVCVWRERHPYRNPGRRVGFGHAVSRGGLARRDARYFLNGMLLETRGCRGWQARPRTRAPWSG